MENEVKSLNHLFYNFTGGSRAGFGTHMSSIYRNYSWAKRTDIRNVASIWLHATSSNYVWR